VSTEGFSKDPAIRAAEEAEQADREKKAISLFDLRKVIGWVLLAYGIVLVALGIFGSEAEKHKAAGININLWTGIALVIVGGFMLAWARLRPLVSPEEEESGRGSGRLRKAT
jgi:uncharacterized membrane protein